MRGFNKILKKRVLILDGATGTNLFDKGLLPGESPANLNIKNPGAVYELQRSYIDSGSDAILTNTFSANPLNFKRGRYKEIIRKGIEIACRATGNRKMIIGDVGPLGILIKPYGDGDFEEVYKIYCEIFETFYNNRIKIFLIETFNSMIEAKAAFSAGRNYSDEILVSFTFQDNCRTLFGETPESIAITFEELKALAIGVNCTTPEIAIEVIKKMACVTSLPLIAKPNAGRVKIEGNTITHSISDEKLAKYFKEFVKSGAKLVGGCCGTSPRYIKLIAHKKTIQPVSCPESKRNFFLVSPQKIMKVDNDSKIIVGERLNPSGRKKIREHLLLKDYSVYGEEAKLQEQSGAESLDVNAFIPEIDETETLPNCVYEVLKNSHLPIFVDTQNFSAARAVLRQYPGIGVYNSIPCRIKELRRFLPMVRAYGFKAVISLVNEKIPRSFEERMANVRFALKIARKLKFPVEDLIFDPLVFSVATDPQQVLETLKTIEVLHKRGFKTILGVSNVSFGLPQRSMLNAIMLSAGIKSGVNFVIINPLDQKVIEAFYSSKALFKSEIQNFIKWARKIEEEKNKDFSLKIEGQRIRVPSLPENFVQAIVNGDEKNAVEYVKRLLSMGASPEKIINEYIFDGMKTVGENYEKGRFFIPDLLKSAEATKRVLEIIKKTTSRSSEKIRKKGKKIILATVKGDIHDIGKNIAGMVFESAGYEVIDLGKDVPAERILLAVKRHRPIAVGLSALLTTTMPEMENVIKLLRNKGFGNVPVIIGGPNVTEAYGRKIGAFAAVQNAFSGLKVLRGIT